MDYSNPALINIRYFLGRRLKILRPIVLLYRRLRGYRYEDAFDTVLMSRISEGITVWDVGANRGFYTEKFFSQVKTGSVVAFEPSPNTFTILTEKFGILPNVHLENVALADRAGEASFFVSDSDVEDSLFKARDGVGYQVIVRIATGDTYLEKYPPNVIKIDVEGFELEVLKGMSEVLNYSQLKYVFVEVHFSIMADRGQPEGPREIVEHLERAGFLVEWLDPSHLVAQRD